MYSSRPHLYYPQNYYVGRFLISFIKMVVPSKHRQVNQTNNRPRSRHSVILTLIIFFFVLPSLPLGYALFRNYQWERNQPPTIVVPNLVGLDLQTGTKQARLAHLDTQVLGQTWYTDLSPGRITLQSPEAGQHVPFDTTIGVELAITTPAVLVPKTTVPRQPNQ